MPTGALCLAADVDELERWCGEMDEPLTPEEKWAELEPWIRPLVRELLATYDDEDAAVRLKDGRR